MLEMLLLDAIAVVLAAPAYVARVDLPVAGAAHAAAADLDGDGALDVAAVASADRRLYVYYGRGDGTFRFPPETYPTDSGPVFIALGDLTDDGLTSLPDILVVTVTGTVASPPGNSVQGDLTIFENSGAPAGSPGRFVSQCPDLFLDGTAQSNGNQPRFALLQSMDDDARLDIVASSEFGNQVQILFQGFRNLDSDCRLEEVCGFGFADSPTCTPAGTGAVNPRPAVAGVFLPNRPNTRDDVVSLNLGTSDPALVRYHLHLNPRESLTTLSSAAHTYRVGDGASRGLRPVMMVGDSINADSVPDLILADSASAQISVLDSVAGGGLNSPIFRQPSLEYPANDNPVWLATGEFQVGSATGPARDVVVSNRAVDLVSVLPGTGDVSAPPRYFLNPQCYPAGSEPTTVAVGRFNADPVDDLLVTNAGGSVSVLLGRNAANGGFDVAERLSAGAGSLAIGRGQFDGDAESDVVLAAESGQVVVLLGRGDGSFEELEWRPQLPARPAHLAVGRFDSDSSDDVAVLTPDAALLNVLIATGSGPLRRGQSLAVPARAAYVAAAPFDPRGAADPVDLAVAAEGRIALFAGAGDGTFAPGAELPFLAGAPAVGLVAAEIDGSPGVDLVVVESLTGTLRAFFNDGAGGFAAPVTLRSVPMPSANALAAGDVDGGGSTDLVVTYGGQVLVLLGDGAGGFSTMGPVTVGNGAKSPLVGELTGGGGKDVMVLLGAVNVALVLPWDTATGNLSLTQAVSYGTGRAPSAAVAGPFDAAAAPLDGVVIADSSLPGAGFSATVLSSRRHSSFPPADAGPDRALCAGSSTTIGTPGKPFLTYTWLPASGLSDGRLPTPTATLPGTYTLTVENEQTGLANSDSVTVTVYSPPVVDIQPNPASACSGSAGLVLDAGAGFASYLWSTGETTRTILVAPETTTSYQVTVTTLAGAACPGGGSRSVEVIGQPEIQAEVDASQCDLSPAATVFDARDNTPPPAGTTLVRTWSILEATGDWSIAPDPAAAVITVSARAGAVPNRVTLRLSVSTNPGSCAADTDFPLEVLPSGGARSVGNTVYALRTPSGLDLGWTETGATRYELFVATVKRFIPGPMRPPSTPAPPLAVVETEPLAYYTIQGICP